MGAQDHGANPPGSLQQGASDAAQTEARRYNETREAEEQVKASAAENPYVVRVHRQLAALYRVRREVLAGHPASARGLT